MLKLLSFIVPVCCIARRSTAAVTALALCVLTAGCAQQRVLEEGQALMRAGEYEQAVRTYEKGAALHPDSAALRSGWIQARGEAITRLVAQAGGERAAGRLDEADRTLARALAMDPTHARVLNLQSELQIERRQREALDSAQALADKQQYQAALSRIAEALKDNPRHAALQALQRRIELDVRQAQARAGTTSLSETRPISLDFRDAGLRTVLDVVTRNSGINFILDKDVSSEVRVTVFLRSARVDEALDLITSTHQLARKTLDAKTVLIYPNTPDKQREHQEQVIKVFYLASAEAKQAAAFLRAMLRIKDPFVDERANMLAIREPQETVALAERLVALYDTGEPEVLMDVEVLEVKASRLTELGVKFPEAFSLTPLPPPGATDLTLGNIRGLNSDRVGLTVSGLLVNLKRDTGDFNILANPRIRARNRAAAKIMIGDKVPVVTATTGTGGFVADSVSYIDVGLKLDVEPTVYADDEVAIKVTLEASSLAREIKTASGSLAYQIGTRNASTTLRLRDGETQMLAGLISKEDRTNASRLPGVGDLPVLGRLFSSTRDDSSRTELVLAITPRVLRNIRRPGAAETELWVGTDTTPRLRPAGGRLIELPPAPSTGELPERADHKAPETLNAAGAGPVNDPPAAIERQPKVHWKGPAQVKVGETVTVSLEIEAANLNGGLRGAPMQFQWSPGHWQVLAVEEGEFFRQHGAATSFTHDIQPERAQLRAGVLRTPLTGAVGAGTVLTLRMKALTAGPAEVALLSMEPVGANGAVERPELPQTWRVVVDP